MALDFQAQFVLHESSDINLVNFLKVVITGREYVF